MLVGIDPCAGDVFFGHTATSVLVFDDHYLMHHGYDMNDIHVLWLLLLFNDIIVTPLFLLLVIIIIIIILLLLLHLSLLLLFLLVTTTTLLLLLSCSQTWQGA